MHMRTKFILSVALATIVSACGQGEPSATDTVNAGVVNLYTARHYDTDRALYDRFTEQTGIRVNIIEGNADQLIARMNSEGSASPADVFITADEIGRAHV